MRDPRLLSHPPPACSDKAATAGVPLAPRSPRGSRTRRSAAPIPPAVPPRSLELQQEAAVPGPAASRLGADHMDFFLHKPNRAIGIGAQFNT
jgi:hypothetical protein